MARALAVLLALLSAASLCRAVFVIEKGGLKVVLPQEAKEKYPGEPRAAPPPTRRLRAWPCARPAHRLRPRTSPMQAALMSRWPTLGRRGTAARCGPA